MQNKNRQPARRVITWAHNYKERAGQVVGENFLSLLAPNDVSCNLGAKREKTSCEKCLCDQTILAAKGETLRVGVRSHKLGQQTIRAACNSIALNRLVTYMLITRLRPL